MLPSLLLILLAGAWLVLLALLLTLLWRRRSDRGLGDHLHLLADDNRQLREVLAQEQRAGRSELLQLLEQGRGQNQATLDLASQHQRERLDSFAQQLERLTQRTDEGLKSLAQRLTEDARRQREETAQILQRFGEQLDLRQRQTAANSEARLSEVRTTLETRLKALQEDNAGKLEQMRATVEEKLQTTLETRLGQSFKLVSERLEAVQRGLGEMQNLASGVGDLKRLLGNVKTRGIFGEVQLGHVLEQLLTVDQYAANVATIPGSSERVEYAIRLPGGSDGTPVWLPIDAKFPSEDYQRLLDAQEIADPDAAQTAARALELRIRDEAKRIQSKYVQPPHSTDFAILFLPTEGLYAEVLRRPGLFEFLQREYRITLAGPTTLSALLNSLQMGFRTLAIEKRSSEVWQLLSTVKSEFSKFATVLEKAERQLNTVSRSLSDAGKKTRTIERKLRGVESLPQDAAAQQLEPPNDPEDGDGSEEA